VISISGVNGSVTLGMDWRKGEGILGTEVTQWGPGVKTQWGGSSVRISKLILILEMGVKLELVLSTVTSPMGSL